MSDSGYYRFPTIQGDRVVFASEDDLWNVPASGGAARRLTAGLGSSSMPALSPDGKWLAFTGTEEGSAEVFVMPAEGGQPTRLTFMGEGCFVVGWTPDGEIVFASYASQPFYRMVRLYAVSREGGTPRLLETGPASYISFGPGGGKVIARPSVDAAFWKRYRGGTTGDLWIDADGGGEWWRLIKVDGNPSRPLWVGKRVYFLSDHDGVGNLYSCTPAGTELRRETHHDEFYARAAASDGKRIVYHAGTDLYLFDPATGKDTKIEVDYGSPRTQRNRKFIEAGKFLESYSLHPKGHMLALTTRGKVASLGNWEGAVQQLGEPAKGRYRLATWLADGKRIVAVSDSQGRESLTIHNTEEMAEPKRIEGIDVSRVVMMKASPVKDEVAISNVRNELIVVDLNSGASRVLDRNQWSPAVDFNYSPDGKWIAYSWHQRLHTSIIKLCRLEDGKTFEVTRPVLTDFAPVFDPEGKYLYFLSRREFNPVYDGMHFDLGFPKGVKAYLVTLRADIPTPLVPVPKPPEDKEKKKEEEKAKDEKPAALVIDLEGIADRIVPLPMPEAIYEQIEALKGKVLLMSTPVEGALGRNIFSTEPPAKGVLEAFDFETLKAETWVSGVTNFAVSPDGKTLAYRAGYRVRVVKADAKPDEAAGKEGPGKKSGWVDLSRVRVSVEPAAEWRQMYGEAWRLQREQFWTEDMSEVDWDAAYKKYLPLLERVSSRAELTDLLWEVQGELGTSHAYAVGGDVRPEPKYTQGLMGAAVTWDAAARAWKVGEIIKGDAWDERDAPPLLRPGVNVRAGDTILGVNGRATSESESPLRLLVNQAGQEVALTVGDAQGKSPRTVTIKAAGVEMGMRYREWVEKNRAWVHEQTEGKCGYVHIPDMGPRGYSEFHRYFLAEVDRDGLLIDVRYNGGGHVSALLLEKLARRRMAYVQSRWFGVMPWPDDSAAGPMVALTNEYAGSDGDIFSHNFKAMKLGPLLGKRTWGGVVGIWPRHPLIDGGLTTQPEFAFWFKDVGWKVENYGVDPDIEVEYRPQDYNAGVDPQLRRGVDELSKILGQSEAPKLDARPSRARVKGTK